LNDCAYTASSTLEFSDWTTNHSFDSLTFTQCFDSETESGTSCWATNSCPIIILGNMNLLNHSTLPTNKKRVERLFIASLFYARLLQSADDCTDTFHPSCRTLSDPASYTPHTSTANSSAFSAFSSVFARIFGSDFCSFRAFPSSSLECSSPPCLALDVFALKLSLHTSLKFSHF
jgi:hypothetical protein